MDCFSCQYEVYICPSPSGQQDCGGILLSVCLCEVQLSGWMSGCGRESHLHGGSAWVFRVHKSTLSRVWKCVFKQGAAVCPCAGLMKKDYRSNPDANEQIISCFTSSHPFCPVFPVEAEEGGQAVLNCFLPWHRLLLGNPEYYFSQAPGGTGSIEV